MALLRERYLFWAAVGLLRRIRGKIFSILEGSWIRTPGPAMILGKIPDSRRRILNLP
jgi:hypothetical protein